MNYYIKRNNADAFSGMEVVRRSIFVGYTIGTIMAASATLPKHAMPTEKENLYANSCTMQLSNELSLFLMGHAEISFQSIWNDPAEDIWDTI